MDELKHRAAEARKSLPQFQKVPPFAKALGVKPAAVYQIESGKTRTLKADTLAAYERVTGFRAEWIRSGKGERRVANFQAVGEVSQPVRQQEETMAQALVLLQVIAAARPSDRRFRTISWGMVQAAAKAITEAESEADAVTRILATLPQE
jgi:transcriptional regulator with XRE-family HTH domain